MKKLFIAASLIIGMIAGAMVLSSFSEPKTNVFCSQLKVNVPIYWQGVAYCDVSGVVNDNNPFVSIDVYQTPNACNSFYAIIKRTGGLSGGQVGDEVWVCENPDYDPNTSWRGVNKKTSYYKYYISYCNHYFYFNM
jgi:hypothetical protein